MTNINDLFCTPEQGRRLAELVPELESAFVWVNLRDHNNMPFWHFTQKVHYVYDRQNFTAHPALTLQELRDVLLKSPINTDWSFAELQSRVCAHTATEFAAWVIERLEEQK